MSLGTTTLKVSGKGPVVIQAPQGGIIGNLQEGTTLKQLLKPAVTLEHGPVKKSTYLTRCLGPWRSNLRMGRVGLNDISSHY